MKTAAFVLTVIFVFATIISPGQFGPEWANYHVLTCLGALTCLLSMPGLYMSSRTSSSTQIFLVLGFIIAMGVSEVANGWFGGVIASWNVFLPSAIGFFFIVANVTTAGKLKILAAAIVAACLVVDVEALCAYYGGYRGDTFLAYETVFAQEVVVGNFARIRGAGFLSDPNDLAQMLLIALPLTILAWRKGRSVSNSLTVLAPAALLLWGIFLTHSRGALVGVAVLVMVVIRGKMGTVPATVLTALFVFGLFALNFTGGRLISADAGADRLSLWASGLQMFKRAPIFGLGFGKFEDFEDLTAHNSFVLCLAELGIVGCTIWVALLVTTVMGLNRSIGVRDGAGAEPASKSKMASERQSLLQPWAWPSIDSVSQASNVALSAFSVQCRTGPRDEQMPTQWTAAIRLAMISFISTCWFLSRTYQPTFYLVVGVATAAIALSRRGRGPSNVIRWISYTLAIEVAAILFIYFVVRLRF
jgi:putative inorganic carbon (HCO3(-)) transporter